METIEQAFGNLADIKEWLYRFADTYTHCRIYDSNETQAALKEGPYELLVALGQKLKYSGTASEQLRVAETSPWWKFVSLHYGLISDAKLEAYVYEPEFVFIIKRSTSKLKIVNNGTDSAAFQHMLRAFREQAIERPAQAPVNIQFMAGTDKAEYLKQVECIRNDIREGKYYEINYCIEFSAPFKANSCLSYFAALNELSRAPFAAYVKHAHFTLLCSSPERFLLKQGSRLLSQPIKGTNKRLPGKLNDVQLEHLKNSEKERAENVMIVDLVRNDLARVCRSGTIKVEELYGAYAYLSVNHLVSSVSGVLRADACLQDMFSALYPMGSMTGAPKTEVMKHIALYEKSERGIYSGCVGYIAPDGDFDLNVVIRTLVYDRVKSEISYKVGSAITYDSSAEHEYEECLLKGSRMASLFGN